MAAVGGAEGGVVFFLRTDVEDDLAGAVMKLAGNRAGAETGIVELEHGGAAADAQEGPAGGGDVPESGHALQVGDIEGAGDGGGWRIIPRRNRMAGNNPAGRGGCRR